MRNCRCSRKRKGNIRNWKTDAVPQLQLGGVCAMIRDNTRTKATYKDFRTLWKDADPHIPILKQARAECAKLQ
jgi:eukaryotic-like serine/threonine-protein kinase